MTLESQQNQVDKKELSPSVVDVTDVKKLAQVLEKKDVTLDNKELNDKLQQNKDKVFDGLVKSIDMSINENTNDIQFMKSLQNVAKYLKVVFVDPDSQYKLDKIDVWSKRLQAIFQFEQINKQNDPEKFAKVSALFETMIFNTPDKVIQNMLQELSNNERLSASLYKNTFVKLDSYLLNAKKVWYPLNFSFQPYFVENSDSWVRGQSFEKQQTIKFPSNQTKLENILANKGYKTIVVKWNSRELSSFKEKFKDPRITYVEDNSLKNVSISSVEQKKTTKTVSIPYNGLDANEILDNTQIAKTLSERSQDIKDVITGNCQIKSLTIDGMASQSNNPDYKLPPHLSKYLTASNMEFKNNTELSSNPNVLWNTELAKARALSIVDFFYANQKVAPNADFNISYKVDGLNTEELKKSDPELIKLGKMPDAKKKDSPYNLALKEKFKQWQNVNLVMEYEKIETVEKPLLALNQDDLTVSKIVSLGILTKQDPNTAGKPKPQPKRYTGPSNTELIINDIGRGISDVGHGIGEAAKDFGDFVGSIFEKPCRSCREQRKMWAR